MTVPVTTIHENGLRNEPGRLPFRLTYRVQLLLTISSSVTSRAKR